MSSLTFSLFQDGNQISTALNELQLSYMKSLDDQSMRGWLDCFAEQASYICTTRENVEQNLPIALMMDDTRARIEDRGRAVEKVWAGTFEDYRTRHFIQNLKYVEVSEGRWAAESNFMVTCTTTRGDIRLLAAGVYMDEIVLVGASAKFSSRKAVLDASTTPRYLVYPI
ncbi:MAG: aromatic-ring-hydroxylating dioxygenase subunit beta [Burkholderiaceae bacterium]|nr:MAG: aromatic-ring-hydroxylating dioxygenase subunit beta [Burkholderiaceae bacterium]TAM02116.1 MAG: aromatic-ring-hydroxylating dioxygenase subunit beta [Pusillimonas sp.]